MDGVLVKSIPRKTYRKVAFRSPPHAQVWFLLRSRNNWKQKCLNLKKEQRRLENRDRDVTKSRDKWAEKARQEKTRARELEKENASLKRELDDLKKKWVV